MSYVFRKRASIFSNIKTICEIKLTKFQYVIMIINLHNFLSFAIYKYKIIILDSNKLVVKK